MIGLNGRLTLLRSLLLAQLIEKGQDTYDPREHLSQKHKRTRDRSAQPMHPTCGGKKNDRDHRQTNKKFDVARSLLMRRQASDAPQVGDGDSGKSNGNDDSNHDDVLLNRRYAR